MKTLGKRRSTECFSGVPDDLKRLFFYWEESYSNVDLSLLQKKNVSLAAAQISKVYPRLPHLSRMESFAVIIDRF